MTSNEFMNDEVFESALLARYLTGESSASEAETVHRLIEQDPRYRDEVELITCAWDVAAGLPSSEALAGMWTKVATAIDPPPLTVLPPVPLPRPWWSRPLAAAAALALTVGGVALVWRAGLNGPAAVTARVDASVQDFQTARGQRGTMMLLDGTRVALGPESRLTVRIGATGVREVVLDGEAVFEVVHDVARPFLVRAGGAVTEDLGTVFGVRAYAGEPVRVVVREGSVAVRDTAGERAVVLAERDLAYVDGEGRLTVERRVDLEAYLAWTTGRLVFRRVSLPSVIAQLERWFDVRVVVGDSALLDAHVNASFEDDGVDEVFRTLAQALDARVERRDRWVYLRSRS